MVTGIPLRESTVTQEVIVSEVWIGPQRLGLHPTRSPYMRAQITRILCELHSLHVAEMQLLVVCHSTSWLKAVICAPGEPKTLVIGRPITDGFKKYKQRPQAIPTKPHSHTHRMRIDRSQSNRRPTRTHLVTSASRARYSPLFKKLPVLLHKPPDQAPPSHTPRPTAAHG